ncbi:DUF6701 domain-containing protein [Marinobacter sp. F4216]|uniref:DUF6701 domain-containing protein n=1 Tax=Marinobacter sp. F4216 TaxID=2874281 RepID=UPI001CC12D86|nr:DUF6701 domain-containing protein [Marinobacter sp. F4216]MBZ2170191.1 hypothetical protein [Marinobacter sp. F4216]
MLSFSATDSYSDWSLSLCSNAGCSGDIPLSAATALSLPWLVVEKAQIENGDVINFQAMDILLKDGEGNTIDYLSVNGFVDQEDMNCEPAYSWQASGAQTSSKTISRRPDGTGGWPTEPPKGNADKPTQGGSNNNSGGGNNLGGFEVLVPATGSVCAPVEVTIRALNQGGNLLAGYSGQIAVQTSSGSGNWAAGSADVPAGVLAPNPDTDNNGGVTYQFVPADGGAVSLALSNATADELTIQVTELSGVESQSSAIQFLENAFLVESSDVNGLDIVAERDHQFVVRAVRRDPVNGECGSIPDYEGSIGLKAWLSRTGDDPGGNAPGLNIGTSTAGVANALPSANNLSLNFTGGEASFSLVTSDVGQYELNLLDDTSGIVQDVMGSPLPVAGVSDLWTVRPDRFELFVSGNPSASDASGPVFRAAGEAFDVQLAAVGANGTPLASYGQEGTPQGADLTHTLVQPVGPGSEVGLLSGAGLLSGSLFSNGQALVSGVSWNEVGIIALAARNDSYLGATPPFQGLSANVGRFIPDRFELSVSPGELAPFCSTGSPFTYTGQAMSWNLMPEITISAMGPGTYVTRNYTETGFMKLNASGVSRTSPTTDNVQTGLSGALIPVTASIQTGMVTVSSPGQVSYIFSSMDSLVYDKSPDGKVGPFAPSLTLTVTGVVDSDGVVAPLVPVQITPGAPLEVRYGRWHLENVYGPENVASLSMPFRAEAWNGSRFVEHADDGCSAWSTASISDPEVYHTLSADAGTIGAGSGGPLTLQPNGTQGTDALTWDVPGWLEADWDGDGALDDPVGLATFGVYRGHDRVIFWQER